VSRYEVASRPTVCGVVNVESLGEGCAEELALSESSGCCSAGWLAAGCCEQCRSGRVGLHCMATRSVRHIGSRRDSARQGELVSES